MITIQGQVPCMQKEPSLSPGIDQALSLPQILVRVSPELDELDPYGLADYSRVSLWTLPESPPTGHKKPQVQEIGDSIVGKEHDLQCSQPELDPWHPIWSCSYQKWFPSQEYLLTTFGCASPPKKKPTKGKQKN